MEFWIKAFYLLLSLSLLIVLHEFGHFLPARWFKTRVEKFYLFFDYKFSLFKKKIGETEWGIGWIPLGGYVKIAGMIDESMDKEQMEKPAEPWEFRSKPAWQRLIIMLGGVTVNLILGYLIFIMVLSIWGQRFLPVENVKGGIWVTSEMGENLGFHTGDKIIATDGKKNEYWRNLKEEILYAKKVTVERDGQTIELELPHNLIEELIDKRISPFTYRVFSIVHEMSDKSPNKAVLKAGDRLVAIGENAFEYHDEVKDILQSYKGQSVEATVIREGIKQNVQLQISDTATIGFVARIPRGGPDNLRDVESMGLYDVVTVDYSIGEAIPAAWGVTMDRLRFYVRQFSLIFDLSTGAWKGLGGFGSIGGLFPGEWGAWEAFWTMTAFLSIILAFMNILPIPILDGGHVMFLLYEMITGREPNQKIMEISMMIGLILLVALMLFANGNDLFRWLNAP